MVNSIHLKTLFICKLNIQTKKIFKFLLTFFEQFFRTVLLVDPTREEEELSKGTITVICGDDEQLVSLYKPGRKFLRELTAPI